VIQITAHQENPWYWYASRSLPTS